VTEHELQVGMAVEGSADYQAQGRGGRLDVPARVTAVLRQRLHGRREGGQIPVFFDRDQCHIKASRLAAAVTQPPLSEDVTPIAQRL
jgi:hypothetical protein